MKQPRIIRLLKQAALILKNDAELRDTIAKQLWNEDFVPHALKLTEIANVKEVFNTANLGPALISLQKNRVFVGREWFLPGVQGKAVKTVLITAMLLLVLYGIAQSLGLLDVSSSTAAGGSAVGTVVKGWDWLKAPPAPPVYGDPIPRGHDPDRIKWKDLQDEEDRRAELPVAERLRLENWDDAGDMGKHGGSRPLPGYVKIAQEQGGGRGIAYGEYPTDVPALAPSTGVGMGNLDAPQYDLRYGNVRHETGTEPSSREATFTDASVAPNKDEWWKPGWKKEGGMGDVPAQGVQPLDVYEEQQRRFDVHTNEMLQDLKAALDEMEGKK
jgi:hypothetical protein